MEPIHYILISISSGIILQIGLIIRTLIREKGKKDRINELKNIENSKINAVGNYEEKSKDKFIK